MTRHEHAQVDPSAASAAGGAPHALASPPVLTSGSVPSFRQPMRAWRWKAAIAWCFTVQDLPGR
jgi:hypothetical protein